MLYTKKPARNNQMPDNPELYTLEVWQKYHSRTERVKTFNQVNVSLSYLHGIDLKLIVEPQSGQKMGTILIVVLSWTRKVQQTMQRCEKHQLHLGLFQKLSSWRGTFFCLPPPPPGHISALINPAPLWIKYALTPRTSYPSPPLRHGVNKTPPTGQKSACSPPHPPWE